jgi:hypothetical protein
MGLLLAAMISVMVPEMRTFYREHGLLSAVMLTIGSAIMIGLLML